MTRLGKELDETGLSWCVAQKTQVWRGHWRRATAGEDEGDGVPLRRGQRAERSAEGEGDFPLEVSRLCGGLGKEIDETGL